MRKIVIGILTRIQGNVNANEVEGDRIRIKKLISSSGEVYPFVSARAVKRGIREKFLEFGFKVDPFRIGEGNKLADSGDPVEYVDNDLFGYLYIKGNQQKARHAPVSMSPIIAIEHTPIQIDFGGRFPREDEAYPTPFEIEVADFIGLLKVVITERCGVFDEKEKTDQLKKWDQYVKEGRLEKIDNGYKLSDDERVNRVKTLLQILLNEGWTYPKRSNYFTMAEHISAIIYCGEKLYPIWKNIENYTFKEPSIKDDTKKLMKVYDLKKDNVPDEEIERMATWLVEGVWK